MDGYSQEITLRQADVYGNAFTHSNLPASTTIATGKPSAVKCRITPVPNDPLLATVAHKSSVKTTELHSIQHPKRFSSQPNVMALDCARVRTHVSGSTPRETLTHRLKEKQDPSVADIRRKKSKLDKTIEKIK